MQLKCLNFSFLHLISATTTFADQSNITNDNFGLVLKGAQNLERFQLSFDLKKSF